MTDFDSNVYSYVRNFWLIRSASDVEQADNDDKQHNGTQEWCVLCCNVYISVRRYSSNTVMAAMFCLCQSSSLRTPHKFSVSFLGIAIPSTSERRMEPSGGLVKVDHEWSSSPLLSSPTPPRLAPPEPVPQFLLRPLRLRHVLEFEPGIRIGGPGRTRAIRAPVNRRRIRNETFRAVCAACIYNHVPYVAPE